MTDTVNDQKDTDQKDLEKLSGELERSSRLFRVLADHSTDGIGLRTLDGKYTYMSPSVERLSGYTVEEVIDTGLMRIIHPDDVPAAAAYAKKSLHPDTDAVFEPFLHRYVRKDGSVRWSETLFTMVPDPEDPDSANVLTTFHDVTALVHAQEELKEANAIKDRFLGMATHDLRSPLVSIRALSELIKDGKVDQSQFDEFVQTIHSTSQHMLDLLDDLLDLSTIESGQLDLRLKPTDVKDLLEQRLRVHDVRAANKDIVIKRGFNAVAEINADSQRLAQVIDNLISNAVKFSSPETEVTISLTQANGQLQVTVADQGQGIPSDEQERLFQPFERLSPEPTGGENSTGLGLFIVKQIVDAHGGDIAVDSRPGNGTSLTVSLPY